jgi:hypothetical protein
MDKKIGARENNLIEVNKNISTSVVEIGETFPQYQHDPLEFWSTVGVRMQAFANKQIQHKTDYMISGHHVLFRRHKPPIIVVSSSIALVT